VVLAESCVPIHAKQFACRLEDVVDFALCIELYPVLKIIFAGVELDVCDFLVCGDKAEGQYPALLAQVLRLWVASLPVHLGRKQEGQLLWGDFDTSLTPEVCNRSLSWCLPAALASTKAPPAHRRVVDAFGEIETFTLWVDGYDVGADSREGCHCPPVLFLFQERRLWPLLSKVSAALHPNDGLLHWVGGNKWETHGVLLGCVSNINYSILLRKLQIFQVRLCKV